MSNDSRKPYTVQPGHVLRSGGEKHGEGATVQLTAGDAERLGDAVKPAGKKAADKTDGDKA